jgi:hypothetical protein
MYLRDQSDPPAQENDRLIGMCTNTPRVVCRDAVRALDAN